MTLRFSRFALVTCCFLAATFVLAAETAPAAAKAGTVTVGDFVVRFADAVNPSHREIKTIDQAKQYFASQGVTLPTNLNFNSPLTQNDVTIITSLVNVTVAVMLALVPKFAVSPLTGKPEGVQTVESCQLALVLPPAQL